MSECIVCKGYYEPGQSCKRCGSDNAPWVKWQEDEPVEQKGFRGLRHFTEPHCHLPFFITIVALALGLMGIGGLWKKVNLFTCLLAAAVSVIFSLFALLGVYGRRHKLREDYLLERVKTAASKKKPKKVPEVHLKVESKTAFVPVAIAALILLLICVLVQSTTVWKLSEILFIVGDTPTPIPTSSPETTPTSMPTPTPTPTAIREATEASTRPGLRERVKRAVPLIFVGGYVGLFPSLVYSSSMLLAQAYTKRMNQNLPQPIFLQDEKLAQIVRKEAEVELGRLDPERLRQKYPDSANISLMGYMQFEEQADLQLLRLTPSVDMSTAVETAVEGPLSPQVALWGQAATWVWDELVRTDDGGIEMKAARHEIYQLPRPTDKSDHRPHPRVRYVVRADPWGRVIEIKRDGANRE
jgi:hypothetical protein